MAERHAETVAEVGADFVVTVEDGGGAEAHDAGVRTGCAAVAGGDQRRRVATAGEPAQPFQAKHVGAAIAVAAVAEAGVLPAAAIILAAIAAVVEETGLEDVVANGPPFSDVQGIFFLP